MGVATRKLDDEGRKKLDGIIQKMEANNEPEDNIRLVVEDFKSKYDVKKKESSGGITSSPLPSQSTSGSGVFAGKGIYPTQHQQAEVQKASDIADPVGKLINKHEEKFNKSLNAINTIGAKGRNVSESTGQTNMAFHKDQKPVQTILQEDYDTASKKFDEVLRKADFLFFKDGKEAGKYVNEMLEKHKDNPQVLENNKTVALAFDKFMQYEGLKKRITDDPDINQLAVNLARESDRNLDNQIMVLEGGEEHDKGLDYYRNVLPQSVQGKIVDRFIHDKNLKAIADENPNVKAQLDELQNGGIYKKYQEYGEIVARNMISREYQRRKSNIILNPIFNKSKYLDKLADEIFSDSPALKEIAQKFKGNWEGKIDTEGVVDEFGTGAKRTFGQMGESFKDFIGAGKTEKERVEQGLKDQYEVVSSGVGGWRKNIGHAANFAGMLGAMTAAGAPLRGAGISPRLVNAAVTASTFYDEELKAATLKHPGESWKQHLEALGMTGLYMALPDIVPHAKIGGILAKAKPEISEALSKLSADATEAEIRGTLSSVILNTVKSVAKGTGEMMGLTAINNGLDRALGLNGEEMAKYHPDNEMTDVAESMLVGLAGPSLLGTIASRRATSNSLYNIASDPERYKSVLDLNSTPDLKEALEKQRENIDFLAETKKELDLLDISEKNKKRFLLEAMNEKFRRDKISATPESSLTRKAHAEMRDGQEVQDRILKGEDVAGSEEAKEFSEQEQKAIDAIKNKDLSGTALEIYGKILADENIAPEQKKMALREISDQLLAEGTAEVTGSALGKDASLAIEGLNHEAPKESEGVKNVHVPPMEESSVSVTEPKKTGAESTSEGGVTVIKPVSEPKLTSVIMPGENKAPNVVPLKVGNETAEPTISKVDDGDLYEWRTKDGLIAGVLTSPTEFRIDGISAAEVGKGQGTKMFESLIEYLRNKGVETITTQSAGDGAIEMHKKAVEKGLLSEIQSDGRTASFKIEPIEKENTEGVAQPPEQIPSETEIGTNAEPPEDIPPTEAAAPPESAKPAGGITHAAVADARKKAGLPDYEGHTPVTHEERLAKAKADMEANPNLADDTMKYVEGGGRLTPQDNAVLAIHKGELDKQMEAAPSKELYDKVSRLAKVLDPEGTFAGQLLESRKLIANEDNLSNFLLDKEAAQAAPLTDKQVKAETEKYVELKKAKEALAELEKADKESYAKLVAELGVNKAKAARKKASKKSHEEYQADRKTIIEAAREALKKSRGETSATIIPGAKDLIAIAPHIKEYMRNLVNEGIDKFDNVVTALHAEFKDVLDGLRKSDIIDILAGEHDTVKEKTKNEKEATIRLIKREAELLKQLEAERKQQEKGKTEEKQTASSRRIEELKKKIKEVRDLNKERNIEEEPVEDITADNAERDAAERKRLERQAEKLQDDLKNKRYLEEKEKPAPIRMSRETIRAKDKVIELEDKIRRERQKDEYAKRNKWLKHWDKVMQVLGIRRIVQTAFDLSIPFRQGATLLSPTRIGTWIKSFGRMLQSVFNPKRYARLMYDIRHSDDYHDMTKDGIVFNELDAFKPEDRNEDYQKSFIYHIPVVSEPLKASNRAADAFLNTARYEMYMKLKNNLESQGLTRQSDPKAYKFAANWAMNMTGRGKMIDALENPLARQILGNTFFGARLMASRFNLLNPVTYFDPRVPKEVRFQAMKDMAGFTATVMASGLALAATGAKISLNPWDSDFLQVRYGDKVYDISGGLANYVRTYLRMINAAYTKATGTKYEGKKATDKAGQSIVNFFRNKLSPNTSYATDAFFGASYPREFDPYGILKIYPMYADDAIKAAKEDGLVSVLTVLLPNLLGVGYGNYATKGQIDKDVDDLLKRNMRSDEMNNEKIKNYKDGGRPVTDKEFEEFADQRDELIRKGIKDLFDDGAFHKKYKDLTKEEVIKITNKIKAAATKKVKHKLFGDKRSNGYKYGTQRTK